MSTSASPEREPSDARSSDTAATEKAAEKDGGTGSRSSGLFDLRLLIGALFVVYGVILTIAGIIDPNRRGKAPGDATININLWTGIGMLVTGALFLLWWRTRPLVVEPNPTGRTGDET